MDIQRGFIYWRVNEVKMLAAHFTAEMLWSVDKLLFPPPHSLNIAEMLWKK